MTLDVLAAVPLADALDGASSARLEDLDKTVRIMEDEFRDLASDTKREGTRGEQLYICLDFDVIHAAMEYNGGSSHESLWSSLCIDGHDRRIVLLPGTAFELSKHMRYRYSDYNRRQTDISSALENAIAHKQLKSDRIRSPLLEFISVFKGEKFEHEANFVLRLIQDRLAEYKKNWPVEVDQQTFYGAIYELGRRGYRVDKELNNRVDAYNYSLVEALNAAGADRHERFVLVTNSVVLQELGRRRALRRTGFGPEIEHALNYVWSSRYAAIRQLLVLAAGSALAASRFTWSIVERLVTYRSWIVRRLASDTGALEAQELEPRPSSLERPDDAFVGLVSSIDSLRGQIEEIQTKALEAQETFSSRAPRSPRELNALVRQTLKAFRADESFEALVVSARQDDAAAGPSGLSLRYDKGLSEDGFFEGALETAGGEVALACYAAKDFLGAYTRSIASLEEFLLVWNAVSLSAFADHTTGKITGKPKGRYVATVGVQGRDELQTVEATSLGGNLDTLELSSLIGCAPGEISFLRIDTPLFASSFERIDDDEYACYVTFISHLELNGQMAKFFRELNGPKFSSVAEAIYFREIRNFRKANDQLRR